LSPMPGATVRDAVFVFDASGGRCAATPDADDAVGGGEVRSLPDLGTRFRQPDGLPLDIDAPGTRVAVDVDGKSGARVTITTEAVSDAAGGDCRPALIVAVRPFRSEDDPLTVQHALGSVLAHELRTPLTTIVGGSQLVSHRTASEVTKQEAAASVAREAQRLNRIVDDLVVLVRSSRERSPDPEPVMLQHVLPAAVESERELYPAANIEMTIASHLPPVMASETHVGHVVRNLLDHAVRYGPLGTVVTLAARAVNGSVEVRVADLGPRRDEAQAARAFDLFATSDRTTLDTSGANVGLVVARQLVIRMGGEIRASSDGAGGAVAFTLPAVRESPRDTSRRRAPTA
jgi:signal transduction histidine kinase